MQSTGFGMSAPIAWDAILVTGDELVIGLVLVALIALSQSVRAASAGVALALLVLSIKLLPVDMSQFQPSAWLPVGTLLTGVVWMLQSILNPQRQSVSADPRCGDLSHSIWCRLKFFVALFAAFSVVIPLSIEISQELQAIAKPHTPFLPLALGFLVAVINVLGFGTLLILVLSNRSTPSPFQISDLRLFTGASLISFGAYCTGRSMQFHWPGDELAIGGMALAMWLIGQTICRLAGLRTHA